MKSDARVNRRRFAALTSGGLVTFVLSGGACRVRTEPADATAGRLAARPGAAGGGSSVPGQSTLGLDRSRDALLRVPSKPGALPLLVLLHGAGGSGEGVLRRLGTAPEEAGVAVLAPDSRGRTWDAIGGDFGRDVAFLDRALARVFEMVAVDPGRIAVGGFSDGASYALSL